MAPAFDVPTLNEVWPDLSCSMADLLNASLLEPVLSARMKCFIRAGRRRSDFRAQAVRDFNDWVRVQIPAYVGCGPIVELEELPITSKRELRRATERFRAAERNPHATWIKRTTGSTGAPFSIDYSASFHYETTLLTIPKIAHRLGLAPGSEHGLYSLTIRDKPGKKPVLRLDSTGYGGPGVRVGVDTASHEDLHRELRAAGRTRPFCISSNPSVLEIVAETVSPRVARATGARLIVSGGAALSPQTRARLEWLFQATVCSAYGLSEVGVVASECAHGRMHFNTSDCYPEVWSDGAGQSGCEGEIVLTATTNTAMPFLRYRTGDLGRISREPCPCGEPSPILKELSGRVVPVFRLADGRLLSPTQFRDTFAGFPWLKEFQVVQEKMSLVRVIYEPAAGSPAVDETRRFRAHFAAQLGRGVQVRLRRHVFEPNCKFQRYKTLLD